MNHQSLHQSQSPQHDNNLYCNHQVVGIALVVEEIGKGSKLVFKYPLAPQKIQYDDVPVTSSTRSSNNHQHNNVNVTARSYSASSQHHSSSSGTSAAAATEKDIFFRLPSRILAKLFRTKPPLCGQPVSLNIEGTVFCCRSVLLQQQQQSSVSSSNVANHSNDNFNQDDNLSTTSSTTTTKQYNISSSSLSVTMSPSNNTTITNQSNSNNSNSNNISGLNGLVLFSIIVAVKPMYQTMTYNSIYNYSSSSSATSYSSSNFHKSKDHAHKNHQEALHLQEKEDSSKDNNNNNNNNHNHDNENKNKNNKNNSNYNNAYKRVNEHGSLHFEAVRRIHLTLSRLCQVLEREEKRCLYVSRQVSHLLHETKDFNDGNDGEDGVVGIEGRGGIRRSGGGSNISHGRGNLDGGGSQTKDLLNGSNINNNGEDETENTCMESNTIDRSGDNNNTTSSSLQTQPNNIQKILSSIDISDNLIANAIDAYSTTIVNNNYNHEEELQSQRLDIMLSALPPPTLLDEKTSTLSEADLIQHSKRSLYKKESIPLYGNLALELAQTYHALSRNFAYIRPSPDALLNGQDGIVYINHHVAVKVEPVKTTMSYHNIQHLSHFQQQQKQQNQQQYHGTQNSYLRSYHTLLFHPVPAKELLAHKMMKSNSFASSSSSEKVSTTRRHDNPNWRLLEKLLLVADDPFKSLSDMAIEAAMTLPSVIEVATSLLESEVCIALPVMTTYTKFGCPNNAVELMMAQRLDFAQQFGGEIPIFMAVSALTATMTTVIGSLNAGKKSNKESKKANHYEGETKSLLSIGEIIENAKAVVRTFLQQTDNVESTEDDKVHVHHQNVLEKIPTVIHVFTQRILNTIRSHRLPPGLADIKGNKSNHSTTQMVENTIIAITSWLRVRCIILEQKEFLASIVDFKDMHSPTLNAIKIEGEENKSFLFWDNEALFKDFASHKHQHGKISTVALAWKYGVSLRFIEAFRDWGMKEKKLSSVIRLSTLKDDWGAP